MNERWKSQSLEFRDGEQISGLWTDWSRIESASLAYREEGNFFGLLESARLTLLVSREYENLLLGLSTRGGRPHLTYLRLPHPSGMAVDKKRGEMVIAATRNPNVLHFLKPLAGVMERQEAPVSPLPGVSPLLPHRSYFLAGCHYLHDLVFLGDELFINSVGMNAILRFSETGQVTPAWWPKGAERDGRLDTSLNFLQLNSVAAGATIEDSYFTASTDKREEPRPGAVEFQPDGKGVLFSGKTREPVVRGLTRPHSARFAGKQVWLANSGYGELGFVDGEKFRCAQKLQGWTRGICVTDDHFFVGTSRVLPRFAHYAPGLEPENCRCAVDAIDRKTGRVVASLIWPEGNQIFGIEAVDQSFTCGFAHVSPDRAQSERYKSNDLYYSYDLNPRQGNA